MDNLNYAFFEEFKRLDKLCGELYGEQHGLSKYIDDMRNVPGYDCRSIPGWDADLEQLVRLRHIRNNLAHTEGAFQEEMCTQKDIDWLREFHGRILSQSDPLAMLHQYLRAKQQMAEEKKHKQNQQDQNTQYQVSEPSSGYTPQFDTANREIGETDEDKDTEKGNLYWFVVFLVTLVVVLSAVFGIVTLFV